MNENTPIKKENEIKKPAKEVKKKENTETKLMRIATYKSCGTDYLLSASKNKNTGAITFKSTKVDPEKNNDTELPNGFEGLRDIFEKALNQIVHGIN